jgi:hypothetical protein
LNVRPDFNCLVRKRGSVLLMCLFIAVILMSPLADDRPHLGAALALVVLFSVVVGTRLSANRKIVMRVVFPLSAAWIAIRTAEGVRFRPQEANFWGHVIGLVLACTMLLAIFDRLGTCEVTTSVIAEAFITYIIIAIAFGELFWVLNASVPDSFYPKLSRARGTDFLYFSMTTLTSLGYGDIVPANSFVRLVSAFESMAGMFYVAVVVARLAGFFRRK